MSQNTGTLITAAVRPNDSLDLIASAFANEVKGGHHGYETLAERDAIITARREWGMYCNVWDDGGNTGTYQLVYGSTDTDIDNNANWVLLGGAGTGDVVGPGSAVDENVAVFDGTTGKIIKDGGFNKNWIIAMAVAL